MRWSTASSFLLGAAALTLGACWWLPAEVACESDANCPTGLVCDLSVPHERTPGAGSCAEAVDPGDDDDFVAPPADIDLIVVMDNSQSMQHIQEEVADFLPGALAGLVDLGTSLRVGVVTTDVESPGNGRRGNLRTLDSVGTAGCSDGAAALADSDDADWGIALSALLDVGTASAAAESGLHAAGLMLCKAQSETWWDSLSSLADDDPVRVLCESVEASERACNRGLLRPDATLAVLVVSDEGDATADGDFPSEGTVSECVLEHAADPLFTTCDCRIGWWVEIFESFGVTLYAVGPSYQAAGNSTSWCDGSSRDIPGPCNPFGSPTCNVDFYQEGACLTGGSWWPVEEAVDGGECRSPEYDTLTSELADALRAL
jgi:hypothetical protein